MSEAEGVSKSFDPRFSRAFQPGYDPRVHREEPPAAVQREEPRIDRGPATTQADGAPQFAVPGTAEPEDGVRGNPTADTDEAFPVAWWRRVNPWYFLLWVLGVAFIVAGIIAVVSAVQLQSSMYQSQEQSIASYVLGQLTMQGGPMLIVLGLATLTSTAVIQAARWRRR